MRIAAKIAATTAVGAALMGFGASAASADDHFHHGGVGNDDVVQQCVDQQGALGLINLDLNLLNQCIANNS
ncbi:hypothetical protein [Nocardiopsis coralliicola]